MCAGSCPLLRGQDSEAKHSVQRDQVGTGQAAGAVGVGRVDAQGKRDNRADNEPLIQADLFNDELPPSVPDQRPMTAEEVEQWMAELPW